LSWLRFLIVDLVDSRFIEFKLSRLSTITRHSFHRALSLLAFQDYFILPPPHPRCCFVHFMLSPSIDSTVYITAFLFLMDRSLETSNESYSFSFTLQKAFALFQWHNHQTKSPLLFVQLDTHYFAQVVECLCIGTFSE